MHHYRKYWEEWHKICDLAKCSAETQAYLSNYVDSVFCWYVAQLDKNLSFSRRDSELPYSWHYFEEKMRNGTTRKGKRYKDALLSYGIARTVKMRLRDFARTFCFFTESEVVLNTVSMETQILKAEDAEPVTFHDLLSLSVDPGQTILLEELRTDMEILANEIFNKLTHREKIALLAREWKLPFTMEVLQQVAGCGRAMLFCACSDVRKQLSDLCRERLPDEEGKIYILLTEAGMMRVGEMVHVWGQSDESVKPLLLFRAIGGENE